MRPLLSILAAIYYSHFFKRKIRKSNNEVSNIKTRLSGYPRTNFNSGICSKFIPYIPAISAGGVKITVTIVNIFIVLFCSIPTRPINVFCINSNLSKLKPECCNSEDISLFITRNRSLSENGKYLLFNMAKTIRCFSIKVSLIKLLDFLISEICNKNSLSNFFLLKLPYSNC